jgi:sRNA-binding carbon storage regulator CsrA
MSLLVLARSRGEALLIGESTLVVTILFPVIRDSTWSDPRHLHQA